MNKRDDIPPPLDEVDWVAGSNQPSAASTSKIRHASISTFGAGIFARLWIWSLEKAGGIVWGIILALILISFLPSGHYPTSEGSAFYYPTLKTAVWDTAKAPVKVLGAPFTCLYSAIWDKVSSTIQWTFQGTGRIEKFAYFERVQWELNVAVFQARYAIPCAFANPDGFLGECERFHGGNMKPDSVLLPNGNVIQIISNEFLSKLILSLYPIAVLIFLLKKGSGNVLGKRKFRFLAASGIVYALTAMFIFTTAGRYAISERALAEQPEPKQTVTTDQSHISEVSSEGNENQIISSQPTQSPPDESSAASLRTSAASNESVVNPASTQSPVVDSSPPNNGANNAEAVTPNATAPTATSSAESTQVQEVLKLTQAKMSDDVILAYLKNSGASFSLSADDILYLNNQGVSSAVIAVMIGSPPSESPVSTDATSPSSIQPDAPAAGSADSFINHGNTYYKSGQYDMAIQSYEQALQIDPNAAHALYGKAVSEDTLRRPTSAILNYLKFLKVAGPDDAKLVAIAQDRLSRLGWSSQYSR